MATQVGQAVTGSMERLCGAAFIPVKSEKMTRLVKPSEVYFAPKRGEASPFRSAFTFVDFGDRANVFLRICGVRSEPSVKGQSRHFHKCGTLIHRHRTITPART